MQLKSQSVEAWQNEKHYSKENNTSEDPISRQEMFKPVDHVKYEGQVRYNICCLCRFLLELQAVVLLMKTATNHRFSLILSEVSGWI